MRTRSRVPQQLDPEACESVTCGRTSPDGRAGSAIPRLRGGLRADDQGLGVARGLRLRDDLVPGAPGAVELADVGQAVVGPGGDVPAGPGPVADEPEEAGAAPHLDEEARDRVALAVEAHQVAGVFLDGEEAGQGEVAPP